jgi:DNA-binding CsgD family transcriptional regulator
LASRAANELWDDDSWDLLSARHVQVARSAGALTVLSIALGSRIAFCMHAGELGAATSLVDEVQAVTEATGSRIAPYGALSLAAWRGRDAEVAELIETRMSEVVARGEGLGLTVIHYASAVLGNALGRYEDALAAAQRATEHPHDLGPANMALAELVEAAARGGMPERAAGALDRLAETARASGTDWALGVDARSRALVTDGEAAEPFYREAIERLRRTRMRGELTRAHLLYGEWLRRERRRLDARDQLRSAYDSFTKMGMEAFAARAERELRATGETARRRTAETSGLLTAQEAQIARLARDRLSNTEIGSQLFLSPRTEEYHLHKIFAKLDISSRRQLDGALAGEPGAAQAI